MSDVYGAPPPPAQDLQGQWNQWLTPANRAALLQFGLQMMQPIASGQNFLGHLGQSIGEGAAAAGRTETADLAQRKANREDFESDSKAQLRGAQATAAEARAATAETRAAAGLERLQGAQDRARLSGLVRAQGIYSTEMGRIRKVNQDNALFNPTAPKVREPSFDEWLDGNPTLKATLGIGASPTGAAGSEQPPYPGARRAPDGRWVVERDGKYYEVR